VKLKVKTVNTSKYTLAVSVAEYLMLQQTFGTFKTWHVLQSAPVGHCTKTSVNHVTFKLCHA